MNNSKYYRIYSDIKNKILTNEYKSGSRLPSKRLLADREGCSIVTVEHAYFMLEDEGYIYSKERCGYFVADIDFSAKSETTQSLVKPPHLEIPNNKNTKDFEYSVWFKTVRRVISDNSDKLFVKSPSKGLEVLRNALSDYLYRYRKMSADPKRIIIGSGAEQLYESIVKILGLEKTYAIEDPSYGKIRSVYSAMGAKIKPLPMGKDGIRSSYLDDSFDVLHVTPFHSFPSGITTSLLKRYKYISWAEKSKGYIIEDDFDSEFNTTRPPVETLYSLCKTDSVIYVNTFSKSLSSALRIGYMILPEKLDTLYEKTLGDFSCSVPVMDQYVLAEFILSGSFERHLNHMRRKIKSENRK